MSYYDDDDVDDDPEVASALAEQEELRRQTLVAERRAEVEAENARLRQQLAAAQNPQSPARPPEVAGTAAPPSPVLDEFSRSHILGAKNYDQFWGRIQDANEAHARTKEAERIAGMRGPDASDVAATAGQDEDNFWAIARARGLVVPGE